MEEDERRARSSTRERTSTKVSPWPSSRNLAKQESIGCPCHCDETIERKQDEQSKQRKPHPTPRAGQKFSRAQHKESRRRISGAPSPNNEKVKIRMRRYKYHVIVQRTERARERMRGTHPRRTESRAKNWPHSRRGRRPPAQTKNTAHVDNLSKRVELDGRMEKRARRIGGGTRNHGSPSRPGWPKGSARSANRIL